jgi:hypothetical protein
VGTEGGGGPGNGSTGGSGPWPLQVRLQGDAPPPAREAGPAVRAGAGERLSAGGEEATQKLTAQQEKMKSCNAEARTKALKGDERKKFMSACLSGN